MLITVPSITRQWRYGGTTAKLRLYASKTFVTLGDDITVNQSYPGQANNYLEFPCTVADGVMTIPEIEIPSTTESDRPDAFYYPILFDHLNRQREFLYPRIRVPASYGSTATWTELYVFTLSAPADLPETYYNAEQVNALIDEFALTNAQLTAIGSIAGKVTANAPINPGTATKTTFDAKGLVTGGEAATTDDINESPGKRYVTDEEKATIGSIAGKVTANAPIAPGTATKVTHDAKGLITSSEIATTDDINESPGKRYVTDEEKATIGNGPKINVKNYGALGDGIADDTAAINLAVADLTEGGSLVFPDGEYLSDTVVFNAKRSVNVICYGTIKRKAGTSGGVKISGDCRWSNFFFNEITSGTEANPALWTDLTGYGVDMVDVPNATVEVNRIIGFSAGVRCHGFANNNGTYFSVVHAHSIRVCRYGVLLSTQNGSTLVYANGNNFYLNEFRGETMIKTIKGSSQIDPFNGNKFFGCNIEGSVDAIDLDFAWNNQFFGMRHEGGPGAVTGFWIKTSATCESNTFYGSLFPMDKLLLSGKAERVYGVILDTGTGVKYGTSLYTDQAGGRYHVDAYRDSGSIITTVNGIPITTYIRNSDLGVVAAADKGITGLKIRDETGIKRINYRKEGYVAAINADTALPWGIEYVKTQTNGAAVKLFLKTSDYRVANTFYVEVTSYVNTLTIRNEADTADVVAAGVINANGLWLVYVDSGLAVKAVKISNRGKTAVLAAGTVTVAFPGITATSNIFVNRFTDGGTVGASYSITRNAGVGFTIQSKDGAGANQPLDTSTVSYLISEV